MDSRKAVNYAVHLAEIIGAQLTLLHFYDQSWRNVNPASAHSCESMLEEQRTLKNNLYAVVRNEEHDFVMAN